MNPTQEQIEAAIRGEGVNHPLIGLFDHYSKQFDNFFTRYANLGVEARTDYARDNMRFLEEGVLSIDPLDFSPLELVATWGRMFQEMDKKIPIKDEDFIGNATTKSPGYELALYIVQAYASEGFSNDQRRGIKERLNSMSLDGLFNNLKEIDRYRGRIGELRQKTQEITAYADKFTHGSFERQFLHNVAENILQKYNPIRMRLGAAKKTFSP